MDINSISSSVINTNANTSSAQSGLAPVTGGHVKPQQAIDSVVSPNLMTQQETKELLQTQVDDVNSKLNQLGVGLAFSVDENTQSSVVQVVDKTTDEVIKQYPNEGSLKIMKNIQDYLNSVQQSSLSVKEGLTGVLFNEII
jgi:flagellar protein FlaG